MRRIQWYGPTVTLLVTTLIVMVAGPHLARQIAWASTDAKISLVKQRLSGNPSLAELSESFRQVAQAVAPSVVHIQVSAKDTAARRRFRAFRDDDLLRRFFGPRFKHDPFDRDGDGDDDGFGEDEPEDDSQEYDQYNLPQEQSTGSGWIYDHDGHIITNNHVVENADVITVRFQDGSEHKATVVGTDPKTDIAVIQVETGGLHPATIADEPVEQGDIIFAFGSPFQFEFSMSQGIVSGKGRRLHILDRHQGYENFIQTDAAINPGNSGGPLTNIYGQVVGMNTAIATGTGFYNGLGFAIPVAMVTNVVDQLIDTGRVSRGYLGIFIADLKPKLAETFGYDGDGVLVENPIEDGPAADAGIERGDIITKVNGQLVDSADKLRRRVASISPGTELDVEIFRDGEYRTFEITLKELPDSLADARDSGRVTPDRDVDKEEAKILRKLGFDAVLTMTQQLADRLDVDFKQGVVVRSVRPQSAAAEAGIGPKDILTAVMGVEVETVDDLVEEINKHDLTQGIRISVLHGDMPRFVFLELPRR